jgi:uncharacterized protein YkwD
MSLTKASSAGPLLLPFDAAAAAEAFGTGTCAPDGAWPALEPSLAQQAADLVNQHRTGMGLAPLGQTLGLMAASSWKARHMAAFRYMAHDDPAPPTARAWDDRVRTCGYAGGYAGENIAEGFPSAQAVVAAWLNSAGHRANIENGNYSAAAMAAARGSDGAVYWCQDFGQGSGPPPPPPPGPGVPTVGQVFDGEFVPAMRNAQLYKAWARANPGESRLLDAYILNPGSPVPAMVTDTGKMLAAAVHMRSVSGT